MEHRIPVAPGVELWAEERGGRVGEGSATPLLLVMGANASGLTWPEALVDRLAHEHRVIRYDHRDTGRSTRAFATAPYAIRDLATDAVRLLDGLGIDRVHVVGMSMGGTLVQLLLLDHPDRLRSATVFATSALGSGLADVAGDSDLPGPAPRVLEYWQTMGEQRDAEAELAWRVEHWRLLNGDGVPFDAAEFRALEERVVAHSGSTSSPVAHALADPSGLDRGAELAAVRVPALVVEAPEDPINPPPHAAHLAAVIGSARLVRIPGMGHALPAAVVTPLVDAILAHTAAADREERLRFP